MKYDLDKLENERDYHHKAHSNLLNEFRNK